MTIPLPPQAGTSLKAEHFSGILSSPIKPIWFEVHAENYMGEGGPAHAFLDRIRADVLLSVHGVGMSIGSTHGLDSDHLDRLHRVVERFQPSIVSEHLAWSTHDGIFLNDLLPLPYNPETLNRVCHHVDQLQTRLKREILLENPSTYIQFEQSTYSEPDFLAQISRRTGCRLLLDLNNVHVSARNQKFSGEEYLDGFPLNRVGEIHLAGHTAETDEDGTQHLIDTHDREVCDEVWDLFDYTLSKTGPLPTLIEWDASIPDWQTLSHQASLAQQHLSRFDTESDNARSG